MIRDIYEMNNGGPAVDAEPRTRGSSITGSRKIKYIFQRVQWLGWRICIGGNEADSHFAGNGN